MPSVFTRGFRSSFPRYRFAAIAVTDFSGGLNLVAAPSELQDNESADMLNVTLDERGGVVKRLGYSRVNASAMAAAPQQLFWWNEKALMIVQAGAVVYKTTDFVTFTSIKTYSSTARAAFTTFNGKLIAVHPADRVSTYDNTTWVDIGAGSPKGTTIAVWQNKCWVSGNPDFPVRVHFSAADDPATWTTFVDIRDGTDAPVTALGGGQGMDLPGRPGLLVFKAFATHRINNSTSGAYTTITNQGGASNHNAVIGVLGNTYAMSTRGITAYDQSDTPTLISTNIEPLFRSTQINVTRSNQFCAGLWRNRVLFSFPYGPSQTTNNRTLEYHPTTGSFTIHTLAAAAMAPYETNYVELYGASPTDNYITWMFHTGADNGVAIPSHYQTRWFEPLFRGESRYRQATIESRGAADLFTKLDYTLGAGASVTIPTADASSVWGGGLWGGGPWGPLSYERISRIYSLGVGRAIAFRIEETSTTSGLAPTLLGDGAQEEVGAWAFYGFRLDFIPLGLS